MGQSQLQNLSRAKPTALEPFTHTHTLSLKCHKSAVNKQKVAPTRFPDAPLFGCHSCDAIAPSSFHHRTPWFGLARGVETGSGGIHMSVKTKPAKGWPKMGTVNEHELPASVFKVALGGPSQ